MGEEVEVLGRGCGEVWELEENGVGGEVEGWGRGFADIEEYGRRVCGGGRGMGYKCRREGRSVGR